MHHPDNHSARALIRFSHSGIPNGRVPDNGIPKFGILKTSIFGTPQFGTPGVSCGIPDTDGAFIMLGLF